ncbi:hypothetical protein LOC68_14495 [Blastopirellula sp. JC732]|uniref:DUF4625 domain-containing protein n=1 Tax=Blastopirellula sediminis TaxID=2894196 RepID=A0A9X1MQ83_9BACT|nr:hypothetical protein [Blastopirellula sediminis]MCC9607108.1 hypothetical protein [Blastopirellula sediminis]MCC9629599.1 hypothetical protein [Blastopirellula sediminis]
MYKRIATAILLALATVAIGCSLGKQEPARADVSGEVTIDGKPLEKGLIHFKTVSAGSIDSIDIVDGKFAGKAELGARRVEISAFRAASGGTPGMDAGEVNYIPAKYNAKSKLTADVTAAGPNEFKFEVTAK